MFLNKIFLTSLIFISVQGCQKTSRIERIYGEDRFETSMKIAENYYRESDTVFVANGINSADALAAVPYAKQLNAPVILEKGKKPSEKLIKVVKNLKVKKIILLGREKALSKEYEKAFSKDCSVRRIGGLNRYETATLIGSEVKKKSKIKNRVFLVNGNSFSDSLALGGLSSKYEIPLIFTDINVIPDASKRFFDKNKITVYTLIGGENIISKEIEKKLFGYTSNRIFGVDRYETSDILNRITYDKSETVILVRGDKYADAISGSALASKLKAPMFLIPGDEIRDDTIDIINNLLPKKVIILGGKNVVSDDLECEIFKKIKFE